MQDWDAAALRGDLISLRTRLEGILLEVPLRVEVPSSGPPSATYTGREDTTGDRFTLALTVTPREIRLQNVWLPPRQRGLGKGRRIVNALVAIGERHAIPTIRVEPRPGSEGFWTACGFGPDSHGHSWYRHC